MAERPRYVNVGPVNRMRTRACIAVLEEAIRRIDETEDDDPGLPERVTAALRSIEADMPELRFGVMGGLWDIRAAIFYIRTDWPRVAVPWMRLTATALRKVLDRLPADAPAPRVMLTVGQIRDALAGYDTDTQVDFQVFTSFEDGGRFRAGAVERWGAKGSGFRGVTVVEWVPVVGGNEDEDEEEFA